MVNRIGHFGREGEKVVIEDVSTIHRFGTVDEALAKVRELLDPAARRHD